MDPRFRDAYNAAFSLDVYRRYVRTLEQRVGQSVPFRLAETPCFLPPALRDRLATGAREIVAQLMEPARMKAMLPAVPPHLDVAHRDVTSHCVQVDFALCRDEDGQLTGRLVELQGFPSLYCFTLLQCEAFSEVLRTLPGLDLPWTPLFGGSNRDRYVASLRHAIVGDVEPSEVILMDLDPPSQKTSPDFAATRILLGVDAVCPTDLEREGRQLYRRVHGKRVRVRRIYNRVVFDELFKKGTQLPFAYTDDLDVTWVPHPNWYWIWSKYSVAQLDHPMVPRAWLLSDVPTVPDDLENYVLKPLFSFAGTGVKVDVTRADLDAIPEPERRQYLLQRKITYAPDLRMPDGNGVKGEVRCMFLGDGSAKPPELVINLVRLSRGKMLGVDQNRDLDWVGGSVGIWPADE